MEGRRRKKADLPLKRINLHDELPEPRKNEGHLTRLIGIFHFVLFLLLIDVLCR